MRILLQDDGSLHVPGHELDVVAPLTEQSGVGCSVTLHNPLRLYPVQEPGFSGTAVAGTPVDCVKLALTTLLPQPPDLVVVGINNGANKGVDVFYSGTVGAATEALRRPPWPSRVRVPSLSRRRRWPVTPPLLWMPWTGAVAPGKS